jgi:hypothetical protein
MNRFKFALAVPFYIIGAMFSAVGALSYKAAHKIEFGRFDRWRPDPADRLGHPLYRPRKP